MTGVDGLEFLTGENPYENRVDRTFAFIDLSGFTRYTDREGDGAAVALLTQFRSTVRWVAARRGVRIAKWLGDGAMMVGVEPETITEAIVDIKSAFESAETPLRLRAGLASGPVILFEGDDFIGQSVNMAARLCSMAEPGEVLAPKSMLTSLMVNTRATAIGPVQIDGFQTPVEVVRLEPFERSGSASG
jgi:class 3 adenylate cyclase